MNCTYLSLERNNIEGRELLETEDNFDTASSYLGIGNVQAAYAKVVRSGDGLQLGRLMHKTGPVLDKLDDQLTAELYIRLIQFLKSRTFVGIRGVAPGRGGGFFFDTCRYIHAVVATKY